MEKFNKLYGNDYFESRYGNDKKRVDSFLKEKEFLIKNKIDFNGPCCDIGCSTGEFLKTIKWEGEACGMEISDMAIEEAKKNNIIFEKNIFSEKNYFELVIFRGTIQHLPSPFEYIERSYHAIKKGGYITFLATPNANSIIYKLTNKLPVLDPKLNFYIPSDITLINICQNIGFELLVIEKPYINSPYSNLIKDHIRFLGMPFIKNQKFPFWGNMMNIIFKKK